tara:strand:- start:701 stop:934 length:234 start_codon:yes stop_codon:yes gene_type:complete
MSAWYSCREDNNLREPELSFSECLDTQKLKCQEEEPEYQEVAPQWDLIGPKDEDRRHGIILIGQNSGPMRNGESAIL